MGKPSLSQTLFPLQKTCQWNWVDPQSIPVSSLESSRIPSPPCTVWSGRCFLLHSHLTVCQNCLESNWVLLHGLTGLILYLFFLPSIRVASQLDSFFGLTGSLTSGAYHLVWGFFPMPHELRWWSVNSSSLLFTQVFMATVLKIGLQNQTLTCGTLKCTYGHPYIIIRVFVVYSQTVNNVEVQQKKHLWFSGRSVLPVTPRSLHGVLRWHSFQCCTQGLWHGPRIGPQHFWVIFNFLIVYLSYWFMGCLMFIMCLFSIYTFVLSSQCH